MSDVLKWLQNMANEEWEYEDGDYALEAIKFFNSLRAENEKLRNAGESIVEWWLEDGIKHYNGAPSAMFALRRALGHIKE